jgi:hypothetical protein
MHICLPEISSEHLLKIYSPLPDTLQRAAGMEWNNVESYYNQNEQSPGIIPFWHPL